MRFTRWYPLSDAAAHAPARPGMLQMRVAVGLIDYPRGKSAMVHYAVADDVRAAALAFAAGYRGVALWCRHLESEGEDLDCVAVYDRFVREFVNRFGTAPTLPAA